MQRKKLKPTTWLLFIIAALLVGIVGIPAFAGIWYIIAGEESIPSAFPSIQLAILATALGALTLWFAHRPSDVNETESGNQQARANIVNWGKSLLFSAFCFTIFGLLSPMLTAESITGTATYDIILKWIALGSLMLGATFLIVTVCFGMVFVWVRKL